MSGAGDPLAELARLEGVPRATAAARAAVDTVLRQRGHRRLSEEQLAACRLAGARASAAFASDPQEWLPGAIRLSTELDQLATTAGAAPGQALARGHALVARGCLPDAALGRLRSAPEVAPRMAGLGQLLTGSSAASGLVVAAIVHAELATLAPFGSGDELLAMAFERVALIKSGVDPHGVIAVEAGHLGRREERRDALEAYATGRAGGVRRWILYCLSAVVDGVEATPLPR